MKRTEFCVVLAGLALMSGCATSPGATVSNAHLLGENFAPTEQDGSVVLECILSTTANLTACQVVSETPAGQGLGQAALDMSKSAKMRPGGAAGQRVRLTTRFRLAD